MGIRFSWILGLSLGLAPLSVETVCSQSSELVFSIASSAGATGDTVGIPVYFDNLSDQGIQGLQFQIWNDPGLVTLGGFSVGEAPIDFDAEFILITSDSSIGWAALAMIMDTNPPFDGHVLPPGIGYELAVATYTIIAVEPQIVPVEFSPCPSAGAPAACNDGRIYVCEPTGPVCGPPFRRGDADANGTFNGLVDALFTLTFQFLQGPSPPCMDAADFDDDGVVNGLVDALAMLNFQFSNGPPPEPPGLVCGADPTGDDVGC